MQEALIIAAIVLVIFFLPRLMGRESALARGPSSFRFGTNLTGTMRLFILMTILWVAGSAAFLKPWEGKTILYLYVGLGPVVVLWGAFWVWVGFKKYRR